MRSIALASAAMAMSIGIVSCAGNRPGLQSGATEEKTHRSGFRAEQTDGAEPWTHLNFHNNPGNFQFAIVADRAGGPRDGVFESAVAKLNLLQPEFVMCIGDLIPGYKKDPAEIEPQWDEFLAIIQPLEMPFFFLPGNHDISFPSTTETWKRRFGRTYYHFTYGDALFLCLNTEDAAASKLSDEQATYFVNVLKANSSARWTFVFMHKPLWIEPAPNGWEPIEAALADRPYTVFAGHTHDYRKYERRGRDYIILATTGGDSALTGALHGQFDHLMWVTMNDDGPRIANLMLDGIQPDDVRTAETAGLVNPLVKSRAIVSDPLFSAGPSSGDALSTRLHFRNEADAPLRAKARFLPNDSLRPDPAEFDVAVAPGAEEIEPLNVNITKTEWIEAADLPALLLDWSIAYEKEGLPPFSIEGRQSIAVETPFPCPRRESPVSVDGRLDEWNDFPHLCRKPAQIRIDPNSWNGPDDLSFRFAVACDQKFLYLAVDTTDDRFFRKDDPYPWNQDGVEVRLTALPDPARSQNSGDGEFSTILPLLISPADDTHPVLRYSEDMLPEGVSAACVRTPTGHATEIAIPLVWLDRTQGKPWEAFRLNIAVDDFDGPADSGSQVCWRPDWRSPDSYSGSGTFTKAE